MGNFNRDRRTGGGFGAGKDFKKRDSGPRSFGSRDGGRPQMHSAVCSECGDACEVPFRPTGDRPVFCTKCFGAQDHDNFTRQPARTGGRSFDRPAGAGRPRFEDKRMFDAICAKCGTNCQVPFRPIGDKPVFCSQCFDKGDRVKPGNQPVNRPDQFKDQFEKLNSKLDKILKALNLSPAAEVVLAEPAVKKPKTAKVAAKKAVKKKKK
ncbi:MAG: CxxC-x17-CxxC domain-containing protein [Patescibacteria group bacterium]|jgi:CxxC-x17-CxxC domain-containing protein